MKQGKRFFSFLLYALLLNLGAVGADSVRQQRIWNGIWLVAGGDGKRYGVSGHCAFEFRPQKEEDGCSCCGASGGGDTACRTYLFREGFADLFMR